jgi:hypothetical protein
VFVFRSGLIIVVTELVRPALMKGVTDLASAKVQIRSVMAGAEVGNPDLACTILEARVQKCMREGVAREWRGS